MKRTHNILFLDDDEEITEIMKDVFEDIGHSMITFNVGQEALKYLEEHDVRVIMTDLKMPQMDGFEFFQNIKETRNSKVPVILLSGHIEKTMISKALALGFNKIIEKPFEMDDVINHVEEVIQKA